MILVDMDGVLCDFEGFRSAKLAEAGFNPLPWNELTHFYGAECYKNKGDAIYQAAQHVTTQPGFFLNLPWVPHAKEGLRWLSRNYPVRICTAPMNHNPTCAEEKRAWLVEGGFPQLAETMFVGKEKSGVPGAFLIDDRPNLKAHHAQRGDPSPVWKHILFANPWNQDSQDHDHLLLDWTHITQFRSLFDNAYARRGNTL